MKSENSKKLFISEELSRARPEHFDFSLSWA